jgi:hypothetical protein
MRVSVALLVVISSILSSRISAQSGQSDSSGPRHLYIDVHQLTPGKVKYEDVAAVHAKDLAVESKYDVQFLKYWVDEQKGLVYCLSSARDTASIIKTHAEAHGLLPANIYPVTDGQAATPKNGKNLFLDVHYLGAGKVTAADVAAAHKKDLAAEGKYGVNFINYWVDTDAGVVMCLSEAKDSTSVIRTHAEAHGLIPATVMRVKQGQ